MIQNRIVKKNKYHSVIYNIIIDKRGKEKGREGEGKVKGKGKEKGIGKRRTCKIEFQDTKGFHSKI